MGAPVRMRSWTLLARLAFVSALASPRDIDFDWWGQMTQTITEVSGTGTGGATTSFRSVFTQAYQFEKGYFMQAGVNAAPLDGPLPKNESGPTFVVANDLNNRNLGSYTVRLMLGRCFVCPSDMIVDKFSSLGPDYFSSTLVASNVTAAGVVGCEAWSKPGTARGDAVFYVLPTGQGTGRMVLQNFTSPSYNESISYEYWWTSAPDALFNEEFSQWDAWNRSIIHGPCTDRRKSTFGCFQGATSSTLYV